MTSKEAFEKIIDLCNHYQHTIEKDTEMGTIWGYPIDNIRKDLKILEIFKKHYDYDSLVVSADNFISFHIYKDDKDFNKIKEWLEDDK